eukprot:TRINITY_DN7342_c0_g2_i1.p1 TRINITY_DN7342_c0_g2~~TRINITY_DN7342_c0_g2_i1.p1  ORF type:complete len:223 (+),score=35.15 TRINITY_DN7342_c0_g2_i1:261-929(+)
MVEDDFVRLVLTCFVIVEVAGSSHLRLGNDMGRGRGPAHVSRIFDGKIPMSMEADWLKQMEDLKRIVLKAYRYSVKLVYDCSALGSLHYLTHNSIHSMQSLLKLVSEYESDWYMGCMDDDQWKQQLRLQKKNLFAIQSQDQKYSSHTISLRHNRVQIGQLNSEAVRGLWSSLSLELLYFANDDDERYSIQAHPWLLRNLTVQASQPPLGYPVYVSPLSIVRL